MNVIICPAISPYMTTNNFTIAIEVTFAVDIIRFASVNGLFFILQKQQLYSRQKLRNRTLEEDILEEDKSKICVFDNSKSD